MNAAGGVPNCYIVWDFQHWIWEKYPAACAGHLGEEEKPTVRLEKVVNDEVWIQRPRCNPAH